MHHFFVDPCQVEGEWISVMGPDVNHIKNVLRMKPGQEILVSDGTGRDFCCRIQELDRDCVRARITGLEEPRELSARIWLFQGLPKADKMELIIQKAVELGAWAVVPVRTKNTVVRLEGKKEQSRLERWQAIAESAAKQSKRSVVPQVGPVMDLEQAFSYVKEENFDLCLIPYEHARGMDETKEAFRQAGAGQKIGIFIGPEGGLEIQEVEQALKNNVRPVSLGKRILRTETAGLAVLSALMLKLEGAFE